MTEEKSFEEKFEDRIIKRLKTDLPDIMTDAELKEIVVKSIERIFFEEVRVPQPYSKPDTIEVPFIQVVIKEMIRDQVTAIADEYIRNYIAGNMPMVQNTIRQVLQEGLGTIALRQLNKITQPSLSEFESNLMCSLENLKNMGQI